MQIKVMILYRVIKIWHFIKNHYFGISKSERKNILILFLHNTHVYYTTMQ